MNNEPNNDQESINNENNNEADVHLRSDSPEEAINQNSNNFNKKTWLIVGGIIILVLIITAGVYAGLGRNNNDTDTKDDEYFGLLPGSEDADDRGPITESGLSGRTCDEPNRRAIGVMMPSDPITRPASGFALADLVIEMPVLVNNVTRLLAVFQCGQPTEIGSVRSARHDYLFLAQGLDAIVGHWGGSYHALNRVAAGEFQTLNALNNPNGAYFRKNTIPAPHNGFTNYDNLWEALQSQSYREESQFEGYMFKDDIAEAERPSGGTLSVGWPGAYRVSYEYDRATNRYNRSWAGVKHVDGIDGTPVTPSTVVVMRADQRSAVPGEQYNDVDIEGEGDVTVYQDGTFITGRWSKSEIEKTDKLTFINEAGEEIIFTRGQVWIMVVEPTIDVTWTPAEAEAGPTTQ